MDIAGKPLSRHPIQHTQIDDLTYCYIEKGEGDTLLFLHGFPDLANTWDDAIDVFSKTHRCIAPFLRGYYPTDQAPDGDYTMKTIASDMKKLIAQLGIDSLSVIGHDWGASVAYCLANLCPEQIQKLVTIAIPHPACIRPSISLLYKARHFLRFRNEKKSPHFTRKKNFAYLDTLYKRWSPHWKSYQDTAELVKETFRQEGRLEAALGYYWSFHRTLKDSELQALYSKAPKMPLLAFAGQTDGALVLKAFLEMESVLTDAPCRVVLHERAGHFLHREEHAFFVQELQSFLAEPNA